MSRTEPERQEEIMGIAGWVGRSRAMAAAHRHLDLEINYVLAGTMTYLVAGRIVTLPTRCLCLLWGGVPHQTVRGTVPAEVVWVTIPLTVVLRWGLPDRLLRPLLADGYLSDAAPRPGDLALLQDWLADLPARGARPRTAEPDAGLRIVMLEIEARLRRLARDLPRQWPDESSLPAGAAQGDRGLAAVEAMAQFILRNFQEDIGVAQIASGAHLHPNYAMTLFRRHTGMTLSHYLTLQRVAHAQRRLVTSESPIQAIAFESGFGSVSHFYETFRQKTGTTPRRFRLWGSGTT
jgi:AraC-like DNA-binding protein